MLLYSLKFAWWNVSLSPAAKSAKPRDSQANYQTVCEQLNHLIVEQGCHFIGLCEVSAADSDAIERYFEIHFEDLDFEIINLAFKVGRTRFDTAVIFNRTRLSVEYLSQISRSMTGQTIKAGQLLSVTDLRYDKSFKLVLCHWPSQLMGDSSDKRTNAGDLVRMTVREFMENDEDVIVMGDFNDNPYDDSVFKNLQAIKCHESVRCYPKEFLYNPFWRSITAQTKYNYLQAEQTIFRSGTLRYKQTGTHTIR